MTGSWWAGVARADGVAGAAGVLGMDVVGFAGVVDAGVFGGVTGGVSGCAGVVEDGGVTGVVVAGATAVGI